MECALFGLLIIAAIALGATALGVFLLACFCDKASEMVTGHRKSNVVRGFEVKLATKVNPMAEAPPADQKK